MRAGETRYAPLQQMITAVADPGYESRSWHSYHENNAGHPVLDTPDISDVFSTYLSHAFQRLYRANVHHIELRQEEAGGNMWLIGQPVDCKDRILRDPNPKAKHGPLVGPVNIRLLGERRLRPTLPRGNYYFRAAVEVEEDAAGHWLRFICSPDELAA